MPTGDPMASYPEWGTWTSAVWVHRFFLRGLLGFMGAAGSRQWLQTFAEGIVATFEPAVAALRVHMGAAAVVPDVPAPRLAGPGGARTCGITFHIATVALRPAGPWKVCSTFVAAAHITMAVHAILAVYENMVDHVVMAVHIPTAAHTPMAAHITNASIVTALAAVAITWAETAGATGAMGVLVAIGSAIAMAAAATAAGGSSAATR